MSTIPSCDYLVIGGGAAGCVVASRLAENPGLRVTLLEAGGPDRSLALRIPGMAFVPLTSRRVNWQFQTEPVAALNGRRVTIHYGKVLGGSSSINGMQYTRGHSGEYDAWRELGCEGWNFEDVLPYFKKSEANVRGADRWHGSSGPIAVRPAAPNLPICDAFLASAAEAGYTILDDINQDAVDAFAFSDVNIAGGRRISASYGYLHRKPRKNLTVVTGALATRILIERGRAVGAEFLQHGQVRTARAEGEVILCGGGIKSPQLLLLSGIGPPEQLRSHGIEVLVDSARVGSNFQNHISYHVQYATSEGSTSYRHLKPANAAKAALDYLLFRKGALGESAVAMFGCWRSDASLKVPDSHVTVLSAVMSRPRSQNPKPWELLPTTDGIQCSLHFTPFSRGQVRLRSADPGDAPIVDADYLSDPRDMQNCIKGVHRMREIANGKELRSFIKAETKPGTDARDDAAIEDDIRASCGNSFHPTGTCAMGGAGSVVDSQLRVRGVEGLRVADASIVPVIPNSGMHAPTIMVAEKAAAMILQPLSGGGTGAS